MVATQILALRAQQLVLVPAGREVAVVARALPLQIGRGQVHFAGTKRDQALAHFAEHVAVGPGSKLEQLERAAPMLAQPPVGVHDVW